MISIKERINAWIHSYTDPAINEIFIRVSGERALCEDQLVVMQKCVNQTMAELKEIRAELEEIKARVKGSDDNGRGKETDDARKGDPGEVS